MGNGDSMSPRRIFLVCLVPALVVLWMARSQAILPVSILGLALFLIESYSAAAKALSAWHRRREQAESPTFSLEGTTLRTLLQGMVTQEKPLSNLAHVRLITTDHGPYACDLVLVLMFHDGSVWNVPGKNPAYPNFYHALREALPLDDDQAMRAAFSISDGLFPLWDKETPDKTIQEET